MSFRDTRRQVGKNGTNTEAHGKKKKSFSHVSGRGQERQRKGSEGSHPPTGRGRQVNRGGTSEEIGYKHTQS